MSRTTSKPKPLNHAEAAFWVALMRALKVLPKVLEEDLEATERMSLNEYAILMFLSQADGWKMRIGDLAQCTSLTISGMTRLVSRLVDEGLVDRQQCDDDGRGFHAVLTQRGFERLERAYPTHLASARRHVIDHLSGLDLEELATAFMRIGAEQGEASKVVTTRTSR
jgi:DNA-binding MarR family transcriptional regulator